MASGEVKVQVNVDGVLVDMLDQLRAQVVDKTAEQVAEIKRLTKLVKQAWYEGWTAGQYAEYRYRHYGESLSVACQWADSTVRADLEKE